MGTAFITGASGGIGLELAKLFAQHKINLVLAARSRENLENIACELSKNNVKVLIYAKDLSNIENAKEIYEDLNQKNIIIDYLVNNAGFGIDGEFTGIPWERELQMLNLNMITLAYFTKVFANDMKKLGSGKILNIASTAAFQPGPYMAGYCATKAFILSLSSAINNELKGTGVTVTTVCPGVTDTKFHDVASSNNTSMVKFLPHADARDVAEFAYKLMMKGKPLGVYGIMNKIMVFSNRFASITSSAAVAAKLLKSSK